MPTAPLDDEGALIERYQSLVWWLARRFVPPGGDVDEAAQDGFAALITAHRRYDPDAGLAYDRWVRRSIRWGMVDGLRDRTHWRSQRRRDRPMVSLDTPIGESGDLDLSDVVAADGIDVDAALIAADLRAWLYRYSHGLTPVDGWVLRGLLEGRLQCDLAAELGVTDGRMCQRIAVIRQRLARLL